VFVHVHVTSASPGPNGGGLLQFALAAPVVWLHVQTATWVSGQLVEACALPPQSTEQDVIVRAAFSTTDGVSVTGVPASSSSTTAHEIAPAQTTAIKHTNVVQTRSIAAPLVIGLRA
jgi:hypothetical protein